MALYTPDGKPVGKPAQLLAAVGTFVDDVLSSVHAGPPAEMEAFRVFINTEFKVRVTHVGLSS